jgi:large subunit ribosomal protein L4
MELAVYNSKGEKTGKKVTLDGDVFGIEPNDHVIWLDVKRFRNAQRQGTHKAKERGEITGSRRKIKKQKGTGTARAGDIKNPLFRGGGRVFGPRPRSYDIKLNKKVTKLARKSALTYRAKDEAIMMLDTLAINGPKTAEYVSVLKNLKIEGGKTLVVVPQKDENAYLSSRNLQGHNIQIADNLNTYEILDCDKIVLVGNSHEIIQDILKK